ncbi:MAG: hypothetical protein HY983_00710 [Candidatus Magasanikbacteria bacterium]|nr:hypothetical protein [Candidatus Magasanikbacteria bacterium]
MADQPPALNRNEQGAAAGELGSDRQKNQFQPYAENEGAGPGNLMKGNIGEPAGAGRPVGSPETDQSQGSPEELKEADNQRRTAENVEQERQRSNALKAELNQSLRPAGALKGLLNRKKIKRLAKEKKEKSEELAKKNKKIKKLKPKWWQWLKLLVKLFLSIFGIGIPMVALQLEEMGRKSLEVKLLKKQAKTLQDEIKKIDINIYNLQNVIKLQARRDAQKAAAGAAPPV